MSWEGRSLWGRASTFVTVLRVVRCFSVMNMSHNLCSYNYAVVDHHSVYIRDLETEKLDVLEFRNMLSLKRETLMSPISSSQSRGHGSVHTALLLYSIHWHVLLGYNDPPGYTFYDQRGIPCQGKVMLRIWSYTLITAQIQNDSSHPPVLL